MNGSGPSTRHIACEFCRKRKLKCDGMRPICSSCTRLNQKKCVYSEGFRKTGPKRDKMTEIRKKMHQLEAEVAQLKMERSIPLFEPPRADLMFDDFTDSELPPQHVLDEMLDIMFSRYITCQIFISERIFRMQMHGPPVVMPRLSLRFAVCGYAATCISKYSHLAGFYMDKARFYASRDIELYGDTAQFNHLDTIRALVLISAVACYLTRKPVSALSVSTALRLAHCFRYHILDISNESEGPVLESDDFTKDLMRRTYWSALIADRLSSQCTSFPIMTEFRHIRTRLPIDDEKFRRGEPGRCVFMDKLVNSPRLITSFFPSLFSVFCFESYTMIRQLLIKSLDFSEGFDDKNWLHKFTMSRNVLQVLLSLLPPLDFTAGWTAANLCRLQVRNAEVALMAVGIARLNENPSLGRLIDGPSFFVRCVEASTEISTMLRTFQDFSWIFKDLGSTCGIFSTAKFLRLLVEFRVKNYQILASHLDLLISIFHITCEDNPFLRKINLMFDQAKSLEEAFNDQVLEIKHLELQLTKRDITTPDTEENLTPQSSMLKGWMETNDLDNPMLSNLFVPEKVTFDEMDMLSSTASEEFLSDTMLPKQMEPTPTWTLQTY